MASALGARDLYRLVRNGIDVKAVHANTRKPFRFLLCGDPALIAETRALLLSGHADDSVPLDAAACIETISPSAPLITTPSEVRVVIFLGHPGDREGANLEPLKALKVPILALTLDPDGTASGPITVPAPATVGEYLVNAITKEGLKGRVFTHIVEASKGVEIAVGRRLPPLRETVAAKLTRDAANNSLKVALASALVDHIPVVGAVLGVFASAGDMVAITGLQMMLLLHIEATYGKDPTCSACGNCCRSSAAASVGARSRANWSASCPSPASPLKARLRTPVRSSLARASRSSWSTART